MPYLRGARGCSRAIARYFMMKPLRPIHGPRPLSFFAYNEISILLRLNDTTLYTIEEIGWAALHIAHRHHCCGERRKIYAHCLPLLIDAPGNNEVPDRCGRLAFALPRPKNRKVLKHSRPHDDSSWASTPTLAFLLMRPPYARSGARMPASTRKITASGLSKIHRHAHFYASLILIFQHFRHIEDSDSTRCQRRNR